MYVWFIMTWEGCFTSSLSLSHLIKPIGLTLSSFAVRCPIMPCIAQYPHTHTHAHDRLLLFPFNFDLSVSVFSSLFFSTVLLLVSSSFIWIFYMVSFFGVTFEESDRERERSKARSLVVSVCLL